MLSARRVDGQVVEADKNSYLRLYWTMRKQFKFYVYILKFEDNS